MSQSLESYPKVLVDQIYLTQFVRIKKRSHELKFSQLLLKTEKMSINLIYFQLKKMQFSLLSSLINNIETYVTTTNFVK